jgi:hypothetical protein
VALSRRYPVSANRPVLNDFARGGKVQCKDLFSWFSMGSKGRSVSSLRTADVLNIV